MMSKKDTYSYKGWLVSDNAFKRAFAVAGHYYIAVITISIVVVALMFALGFGSVVQGLFTK